jgi:hypothetical protein
MKPPSAGSYAERRLSAACKKRKAITMEPRGEAQVVGEQTQKVRIGGISAEPSLSDGWINHPHRDGLR